MENKMHKEMAIRLEKSEGVSSLIITRDPLIINVAKKNNNGNVLIDNGEFIVVTANKIMVY